jgi:hypothetical protein
MSNSFVVWLFVEEMSLVDVHQHRQHSKPIERKLLCIFLVFLKTHPPQAVRGRCRFIKIKIAETCKYQNLKNYILTYQVISNKFTIVRLCTVQRYHKPCGTRHKFPNPIKYPGRFMECIKKTGNKQLYTLEPMKVLV